MKRLTSLFARPLLAGAFAAAAGTAAAKLPVPPETPESKAKAQEAAGKAAAALKKDTEDLGRYQDKAVANHKERQAK